MVIITIIEIVMLKKLIIIKYSEKQIMKTGE